ncbi:alpha/beta family hydrolase [Planctomicrobium sp. SH668]|uniref:alpha/beta family hydrolase n=1 Tax=Planctomicrobium sp. SH668 TaxID=3448126 RepID=UPI003F5B1EFC
MPPHNLKFDGPKRAKTCVVLTHGAGESSDSTFLTYFAENLAAKGHRVVRFDFPFMVARSTEGRKRPTDKEDVLKATWKSVVEGLSHDRLVIGGKALGGRIASMVADEIGVAGVLCLGFPFHASGRPDQHRIEPLDTITTPTLIVQGEIDQFGDREEVQEYVLSPNVQIHWVPEGDHGYNVKRGAVRDHDQNLKNATYAIDKFLFEVFSA